MASSKEKEAFVWVWLPRETEPVVAGRLVRDGESLLFNYGQSYLSRVNAISLYEPELPEADRRLLLGRQFLNGYAFEELDGNAAALSTLADKACA